MGIAKGEGCVYSWPLVCTWHWDEEAKARVPIWMLGEAEKPGDVGIHVVTHWGQFDCQRVRLVPLWDHCARKGIHMRRDGGVLNMIQHAAWHAFFNLQTTILAKVCDDTVPGDQSAAGLELFEVLNKLLRHHLKGSEEMYLQILAKREAEFRWTMANDVLASTQCLEGQHKDCVKDVEDHPTYDLGIVWGTCEHAL